LCFFLALVRRTEPPGGSDVDSASYVRANAESCTVSGFQQGRLGAGLVKWIKTLKSNTTAGADWKDEVGLLSL
jgi:hypothetical protein